MRKVLLILASLAMLMISSCSKLEALFSRSYGSNIVFGSSSMNGSNTKAVYSGELDVNKYERIDWVAGDSIRIYCPQASAPSRKYADYVVLPGTVSASGRSSSAKIEVVKDSSGLKWGNPVMHYFTALYPAPGSGVAGTSVSSGSVTCVLPSSQTHSGINVASESSTAVPNPDYIYLAGNGKAMAGDDGESGDPVNLYFDPAVTTFQFVLQNAYESQADMTIQSAGITTTSGLLSGTYTVNVTGIGSGASADSTLTTAAIGKTGLVSPTLSMTFDPIITVPYGKTLTFTLFAQPGNNITKLTFWFVDEDGYRRSFAFKYIDSTQGTEGWVNFTAFHKSIIRGLMAPESAGWTVNTIPVVASWGADDRDLDIDSGNTLSFSTPAVITWTNEAGGNLTYSEN